MRRAALDTSVGAYLKDHYASSNSASAVFSSSIPDALVSAVSTIASEDAEEEQKALKEEPSEEIGEEGEAKTPTEAVPAGATEEIEVSGTAEAVVPENEQGDTLLEKVAQSMEAVVVAAQETLLGTGETASTEDADKDLGDEKKNVDEQDTTPAAQAPLEEQAPDLSANAEPSTVISEQQEPVLDTANAATEGVNPSNPAESSLVADPIYTIAIVGNKYNTQNFW